MKNFHIWCAVIAILIHIAGCGMFAYVRFGPQKVKRVIFIMEEQVADPNIPKGLIKVGAISL